MAGFKGIDFNNLEQRIIMPDTEEIPPVEVIGEKGHKLLKMAKAGLKIPPFFIIITDGTGKVKITDELQYLFAKFKKPLIVRSCHPLEGSIAAFSGQFDSHKGIVVIEPTEDEILDTDTDEFWEHGFRVESLRSAIKLILENADAKQNPRLEKYLTQYNIKGLDLRDMNIIVEEQINVDVFGMFVTSDQNNPDKVLIHYKITEKDTEEKDITGGGKGFSAELGAKDSGGAILYNRKTHKLEENDLGNDAQGVLKQFGEVAGKIQALFGTQLIELGACDGEVFVFQSRDIHLKDPKYVPRLAHYTTLNDDLDVIGYGYYYLPVLVVDSMENIYANPSSGKFDDKYRRLQDSYNYAPYQNKKEKLITAFCEYYTKKLREYQDEITKFQEQYPEYMLVIKDPQDIVRPIISQSFSENDYTELNALIKNAKVVARGKTQGAINHEAWENVDFGAITITPPTIPHSDKSFTDLFTYVLSKEDTRPKKIFMHPSKQAWLNNVSIQAVSLGSIQTGGYINVLSNTDGVYVWLGQPLVLEKTYLEDTTRKIDSGKGLQQGLIHAIASAA